MKKGKENEIEDVPRTWRHVCCAWDITNLMDEALFYSFVCNRQIVIFLGERKLHLRVTFSISKTFLRLPSFVCEWCVPKWVRKNGIRFLCRFIPSGMTAIYDSLICYDSTMHDLKIKCLTELNNVSTWTLKTFSFCAYGLLLLAVQIALRTKCYELRAFGDCGFDKNLLSSRFELERPNQITRWTN